MDFPTFKDAMLERYAYILFINNFNHLSRYKLSFDLVESRVNRVRVTLKLSNPCPSEKIRSAIVLISECR